MDHIFISYSRKDEQIVTKFAESLRRMGFEVWQDISGKRSGIPYSVKWFDVIEEAIFTASAAILFRNEAWDASVPCQQEFQLIQETTLPFRYMHIARLMSDEASVINETAHWCREQIISKENGYRRWMLSGAYRVYKGLPSEAYFLTGRHFIRNGRWLKECTRIAAQKDFRGPWVESLHIFLRRIKRKLWGSVALRGLAGAFLLVALTWALSVVELFQMVKISNETAYIASKSVGEMRRIEEYNPIQAMQLAAGYRELFEAYSQDAKEYGDKKYILQNQGDTFSGSVNWDMMYYTQNSVLSELLSQNYPAAFYASAADCPLDISDMGKAQSNERYTVSLSVETGQVFIYDRDLDITRQLLLASVPEVYCFSDTGNRLALAAGSKAYVYDLLGEAPPRLLAYNFENICGLKWAGDKIYAVTENGHIIVWDDPMPARRIQRENLASGAILQLDGGEIMAIYIDDDCLIKNTGNNETVYELSLGGEIDQGNIALSFDGAYAAVSYRPDGSSSDWIGIVDLTDGMVRQRYDTGYTIVGYAFSPEGDALFVTCYADLKIACIDLKTGAIQESSGETYANPYTLIVYENKILVCDTGGILAVYNDALELVGDYRIIGFQAPQKQLAVSLKYDCLLTAGRGGNAMNGFFRTWISSNEQAIFVSISDEPMLSTTAVAVTTAGDFVAYGNAGGSIYIWDVGVMEQVWSGHCIPESIINLRFSDNSRMLYALGSSGTIYETDISDILPECEPGDPKSIWQVHINKAEEISQNMDYLGLPGCN